MIAVASTVTAPSRPKKSKRRYKLSKLDDALISGLHNLEHAADLIYAQGELDEDQNDSAYAYISRCETAIERMRERVKRPASWKGDADNFLTEIMASQGDQ